MQVPLKQEFLPKVLSVSLYFAFFIALLVSYKIAIVPNFGIDGYRDDFNWIYFFVCSLAVPLLVSLIPQQLSPGHCFLHFALALVVLPSLVLSIGGNLPAGFLTVIISCFVFLAISSKLRLDVGDRKLAALDPEFFLVGSFVSTIAILVVAFAFGAGSFLNFDLTRVYEVRGHAAKNLPAAFGYLIPLFAKVILAIVLAIAFVRRRFVWVMSVFVTYFVLFGVTNHKAMLVYPLIVAFTYWAVSTRYFVLALMISLLLLIVVSCADLEQSRHVPNHQYGLGWTGSILLRRGLFLPALLNFRYFDFFSDPQNQYLWSFSKITFGLVAPPSNLSPSNIIGKVYFNNASTSANTGWIGAGLAQAGFWGAIIYSIGLGTVLAVADSIYKKHQSSFVTAALSVPIITALMASDFLTSLLTHGLLLSIVIVAIIAPIRHEPQ